MLMLVVDDDPFPSVSLSSRALFTPMEEGDGAVGMVVALGQSVDPVPQWKGRDITFY